MMNWTWPLHMFIDIMHIYIYIHIYKYHIIKQTLHTWSFGERQRCPFAARLPGPDEGTDLAGCHGASLRQIRPGFRVSFDGDPAAGLGVFGGPGAIWVCLKIVYP